MTLPHENNQSIVQYHSTLSAENGQFHHDLFQSRIHNPQACPSTSLLSDLRQRKTRHIITSRPLGTSQFERKSRLHHPARFTSVTDTSTYWWFHPRDGRTLDPFQFNLWSSKETQNKRRAHTLQVPTRSTHPLATVSTNLEFWISKLESPTKSTQRPSRSIKLKHSRPSKYSSAPQPNQLTQLGPRVATSHCSRTPVPCPTTVASAPFIDFIPLLDHQRFGPSLFRHRTRRRDIKQLQARGIVFTVSPIHRHPFIPPPSSTFHLRVSLSPSRKPASAESTEYK